MTEWIVYGVWRESTDEDEFVDHDATLLSGETAEEAARVAKDGMAAGAPDVREWVVIPLAEVLALPGAVKVTLP